MNENGNGIVFLSAARTAMGTFGGSLKDKSAIDLGVVASEAAVERAGAPAEDYGHVVFGNVMQTSADAIYMARHVGLRAGLPIETPALTVNRLCGSGFQAVIDGSQEIRLGDADVCLVGGTESMSQAPHIRARGALGPAARTGPGNSRTRSREALTDPYCGFSMAQTAENLAEEYGISRSEVDEVAVRSQRLAKEAWDAGRIRRRGRARNGRSEGSGEAVRAGRAPAPGHDHGGPRGRSARTSRRTAS